MINLFSMKFEDPTYGDDYIYEAIRLPGVVYVFVCFIIF